MHHDNLGGRGEVPHSTLETAVFPALGASDKGLYAVDDMQVTANATMKSSSATAPTDQIWQTPLRLYQYVNASNEYSYFTMQMSHSYKSGTDLYFHVHFTIGSTVATGTTVVWELIHSEAKWNQQFTANDTDTMTWTASGTTASNTHCMTGYAIVASTAVGASSFIVGRLRRASDSYTGNDVYLLGIDAHYRRDTLGTSWGAG